MNRHVTINEVAKALDCSTKTVRRQVDKGVIPVIQPGGKGTHLRFDIDDVIRAVKKNNSATEESELTRTEPAVEKLSGPEPNWKQQKES